MNRTERDLWLANQEVARRRREADVERLVREANAESAQPEAETAAERPSLLARFLGLRRSQA